MKKTLPILSVLAIALPSVALAATSKNLSDLIIQITGYLNVALVLLMGVAMVFFVWYVIKYYVRPNADRKEGGLYIMYSLIGFFVILSFWGLVNVLQNTFGLQNAVNRPTSWASFV